jgi:hypothetical protein
MKHTQESRRDAGSGGVRMNGRKREGRVTESAEGGVDNRVPAETPSFGPGGYNPGLKPV